MKVEVKEIYKCEHCNKLYQLKHFCLKHEEICRKNPKNYRPCFNCNHLTYKKTKTYDYGCGDSENVRELEMLYCSVKDIFLYPPKVEIKGNMIDNGEINDPMPKQCKIYDETGSFDLIDFLNHH